MANYKKGEAANRSQTYNKVWKKGEVKESGTASAAAAKLAAALIKRFGKNAKKKAPNKKVRDAIDSSPKWRNFSEEKANAKAYYQKQIARQTDDANRRIAQARRAKKPKQPTQKERIARLREEAQELQQARYKYKGGSGTRMGRPTR